jgi:hypothetical protein
LFASSLDDYLEQPAPSFAGVLSLGITVLIVCLSASAIVLVAPGERRNAAPHFALLHVR